ncbi:MAG: hypothetical protein H7263_03975, partial [Candidatus Sericytochromatia bacterium]|nr:hypothetical protein [Candidatus Sericytochromatia bacterium]
MSSFDFSFINNSYNQPQAQQLSSTSNQAPIKTNDPEQKNSIIKNYPKVSSEESAITEILKSQNLSTDKKNRAIAMALYYQDQDINQATMAYMHKMMAQYRLDTQIALEAFLFLVANSLEITDHRIQAVKEIMDNKDFVTDIKDLSGKIDELNQCIDDMAESNIVIGKVIVEDIVTENNQDNKQINNIDSDQLVDSNANVNNQVNKDVNQSLEESNLLIDNQQIKSNTTNINLEQKVEIKSNNKTIDIKENVNSTDKIISKNDPQKRIQVTGVLKTNKKSNFIEIKNVVDNTQKEKITNKKIESKIVIQQKSEEKITNLVTTKNKENVLNTELKTNNIIKTKIDYKSINSQITQYLATISAKNTLNNVNVINKVQLDSLLIVPDGNEDSSDNIKTFDSGLRNTGISDQSKEIIKNNNQNIKLEAKIPAINPEQKVSDPNKLEIDKSIINPQQENSKILNKNVKLESKISEIANNQENKIVNNSNNIKARSEVNNVIKSILISNIDENTPKLFKLNGKDVVISKSSDGKIYFKNITNLAKKIQEPIKLNLNNQTLYVLPTAENDTIIPALKVDNSVSKEINNLFKTKINNKETIVLQDPFSKDKTVLIPLNNKREFKNDKEVFFAEDKNGNPSIFVNRNNKEVKLINLADKNINNTEIKLPAIFEEKLIFLDPTTNTLKSTNLKSLSKSSEITNKNISVINDNGNISISIPDKNGVKVFDYPSILKNSTEIKTPQLIDKKDGNIEILLPSVDSNKPKLLTVSEPNLKNIDNQKDPFIIKVNDSYKVVLPEKNKLSYINIEKKDANNLIELKLPIKIDDTKTLLLNNKNKPVIFDSTKIINNISLNHPLEVSINGKNNLIIKDSDKIKILPLENIDHSQMQELDFNSINSLEMIDTTTNKTFTGINENINILKSQLGIIDDLRNITSNPKINNSIDPKNNINNKINAQSEINNKNQ